MRNLPLKIAFLIVVAVFSMGLDFAVAQYEASDLSNLHLEDFSVNFSPENPGANTPVSAKIISYSFDVDRAEIAWFVNGKAAGSGKNFSFTASGLGSLLTLTVRIITPSGDRLSKTFSFRPAEVDLLWETPSYTPLQYRGKALAGPSARIKITAIPQGMPMASSNLIYEWRRNYKNVADASGKGKKTFTFYAGAVGSEIIEATVSTPDKSAIAVKKIMVAIGEPKVLFYEEHPLEGPQYQQELSGAINLNKPEIALRADPYFFTGKDPLKLLYEWRMNDKKISTPQKPNLLYLSVPAGSLKGSSLIGLSLSNPSNIMEMAEKALRINFNFQ